jgi:hypothetical protein
MRKTLAGYTTRDLVKLAVGAGAYSSSPVWGGKGNSPASNPHALGSGPTGGFGAELGKSLAPAGKAVWNNGGKQVASGLWNYGGKQTLNTGINTLQGIGTTAVGLANTAAGGIGSLAAGINQGAARLQDAAGLTHDATSMADAFAKPMNQAFVAGLKDTVGGAADTLSGGHYNYDGTGFVGAQPTAPHPGTAVEQMRSGIRDQLGRDSNADALFRATNGVADFAAQTAGVGAFGRGLNVGAQAMQGSRVAAPALNAVANAPVVGKPLAAAGNWMAGPAPAANMFQQTLGQYARASANVGAPGVAGGALARLGPAAARAGGMVDDAGRIVMRGADEVANVNSTLSEVRNPTDRPAEYDAYQQQVAGAPALTSPEATQPNPQGGPSTAQKPPAPAPAEPAPAPAQTAQPAQATPPATHVGAADQSFSPEIMAKVQSAKTPEARQAVQQEVAGTVKQIVDNDPVLAQGMKDLQAGKADTDAAKAFQARIDNAQHEMIAAEFESLKKANPTANLSDPQTYGSFLSQATEKVNSLPFEHKMLMGLGLGGGLIGILSSLFGDGGMGGGLLGMLGLAVGGGAAAAGGVFGNQAQAATGKMLGDFGNFMGMIPDEARDAKNLMPGSDASKKFEAEVAKVFQEQGPEAAQKLVDSRAAQFKPLEQMHAASPQFAHSYLMGMDNGPKTPEEAASLYEQLSGQVAQARDPNFLRNKATEMATEKVRGMQNNVSPLLRVGARLGKDYIPGMKSILPTSMQELIDDASTDPRVVAERKINELYKGASMNIAQEIYLKQAALKAARCWAGYEPVPGKAPYSENSCRPKRKKKTKSKEPAK